MTKAQRHTMSAVYEADAQGRWFRARGNGERVVLANLFRKKVLARRAWRGIEGDPDAAHEYRLARGSRVLAEGACVHKITKRGENAPRRWGSHQTEVCAACGAFRLRTHHGELASDWQPATEYAAATAEMELD